MRWAAKEGGEVGARIVVVDDHEIVRGGIRKLFSESRPEWEICGEATSGEDAIEAVRSLKPDVVILDISMPKMSGLDAASKIAKLGLNCRVLLFTMYESMRLAAEAKQVGAHGYVLKSQAARHLLLAIDRLLAGGTFFGGPDTEPEKGKSPSSGGFLIFLRELECQAG